MGVPPITNGKYSPWQFLCQCLSLSFAVARNWLYKFCFGVDPLQFALIFVVNVVCGICTPPFGPTIFLAAGIAKAPLERCMKAIIPFCVVQIAVILMISYIPALTLTLPRLLGLY